MEGALRRGLEAVCTAVEAAQGPLTLMTPTSRALVIFCRTGLACWLDERCVTPKSEEAIELVLKDLNV